MGQPGPRSQPVLCAPVIHRAHITTRYALKLASPTSVQVARAPEAVALVCWGADAPQTPDGRDGRRCGARIGLGSTRLRADLRRSGKPAEALRREEPGRRDICIYAHEPRVVVAASRNEFFIDPGHTYRLRFHASRADDLAPPPHGVAVRMLKKSSDADAMTRVFATERLTELE